MDNSGNVQIRRHLSQQMSLIALRTTAKPSSQVAGHSSWLLLIVHFEYLAL